MKEAAVVIPVYRTDLSEHELMSLRNNIRVMQRRHVVFITPASLYWPDFAKDYPHVERVIFDDSYFSSIAGYNRLMMSPDFYSRFTDFDYILVCQTDAWLFRDDLALWMEKGYDYVGAPWPVRPSYSLPHMRLLRAAKRAWCRLRGVPSPQETDWKTGNGGLSLRKVQPHLNATQLLAAETRRYHAHPGNHMYNEDVFFSLEVNRHGLGFRYPGWREALSFSFDKNPQLCWRLSGGRLPMGCHAWFKRRMKGFWFPVILENKMPR